MNWIAECHVEGLGFPEGPVALADGSIAFVDLLDAKIRAWHPKTGLRLLAEVSGAPNGMRLGPDGSLWIANNGGISPNSARELVFAKPMIDGCIQRLASDGAVTTHTAPLPGLGPNRPNDLILTTDRRIIFTDPQNWEVLSSSNSGYNGGQLLLADDDGMVTLLAKMTGFPNGLAFHPDGTLLVGQTTEHRIVQFDWDGVNVSNGREFCRFAADFDPDGMIFDDETLIVAGSGGDQVAIVDLHGNICELIYTGAGSDPTNVCVAHGRIWLTLGYAGKLVSYPRI